MTDIVAPNPVGTAPTTPDHTNRDAFPGQIRTWRTWEGGELYPKVNALAQGAYSNAQVSQESALVATSAAAAAAAAGAAALWSVATAYTQGQAAVSAVDYLTYRATTAITGGVDPALDTGGTWVNVGAPPVTIVDVAADATLTKNIIYRATTACSLTLPASPSRGDIITVTKTGTHAVTLLRNGSYIASATADGELDSQDVWYSLIYIDGTAGWVLLND